MTVDRLRESLVTALRRGGGKVQYANLFGELGLDSDKDADRRLVRDWLEELSRSEHAAERPLLSVLVVDGHSQVPLPGFFVFARGLGLYDGATSLQARKAFVDAEIGRLRDCWNNGNDPVDP